MNSTEITNKALNIINFDAPPHMIELIRMTERLNNAFLQSVQLPHEVLAEMREQ